MDSKYDDAEFVSDQIKTGNHRDLVGGLWDQIGRLQLDFMLKSGLRPANFLLDVGCGCLRGGIRFVDYLDKGHYYGIDISQPLLEAGYNEIKSAALLDKLPFANLHCTDNFDAGCFGQTFDFAIAQSVFTHLSFNNIRRCLENLPKVIRSGGKFCATYFKLPDDQPSDISQFVNPAGVVTFGDKDPYHYKVAEFQNAIKDSPWTLVDDLDWNHPRAQRMLVFVKR